MELVNLQDLSNVQKTAVFTLIGRAKQSKAKNSILKDLTAEKILDSFSGDDLLEFKGGSPTHSVRAEYFDQRLATIIQDNTEVTVICPGIGLETQFERLDNGSVYWYGLDFEEIINLREKLLPDETGRRKDIPESVLDSNWIDKIEVRGKVVIVCSGLLMYFEEHQVLSLFKLFSQHFSGADIIFDAISSYASQISLDRESLKKISGDEGYLMPRMPWGVDNIPKYFEEKCPQVTILHTVNGLMRHPFIYGLSTGFKILMPWYRKKVC